MSEPGLDFHEWETRWAEFQELAENAPDEALPEIVRAVEQMLTDRGDDLENPVVAESEDPDIARDFLPRARSRERPRGGDRAGGHRDGARGSRRDPRLPHRGPRPAVVG
jgi:hypothetical protein